MTLLPVTLFLYVTAMVFALLDGGFPHRSLYRLFLVCAWAGFLIESAALGSVWAHRGIPPAVNLHELFLVTAWAILGLYLLLYPMIQSRRILPFFLMPLVTLNFLLGNAIPETAVEPKPYYFSAWFAVHILLLVFGMAFFFLSFLYAAIFIMQDHSLRNRRSPSPLPIPSLEEAERWSARLLMAGFPVFTLGIVSSAAYGIMHGRSGDWKPGVLEISSVVAWVILGLAIYGWLTAKVHPRRRSWLVVAGAAFSVLIILGIVWH